MQIRWTAKSAAPLKSRWPLSSAADSHSDYLCQKATKAKKKKTSRKKRSVKRIKYTRRGFVRLLCFFCFFKVNRDPHFSPIFCSILVLCDFLEYVFFRQLYNFTLIRRSLNRFSSLCSQFTFSLYLFFNATIFK